ncbi:MAG: hypothetical protein AAF745_18015, partial [Planctomycetota bacterium]
PHRISRPALAADLPGKPWLTLERLLRLEMQSITVRSIRNAPAKLIQQAQSRAIRRVDVAQANRD